MIENDIKPSTVYTDLARQEATAWHDYRAGVPDAWKRLTEARNALEPLRCRKCKHRLEGLIHTGC